MSSLVISGDTSGSVTLQAPSVSGSTVLTLPSTSGTVITTASGTASSATTATTATNLAGGAQGSIPYQSASGTTALLAADTSGKVLTTQGSGANPTWTTPSTGAMTLISTSTVSNVASVAFTSLTSAYSSYLLVVLGAYNTGSGGYPLYMQVSTDNSTYISTATYMYSLIYSYARAAGGAVAQLNNFSNASGVYDTKIYLSNYGSGGSSSVTPLAGEVKLFNPANGTQATVIQSRISSCDSTPTFGQEIGFSANTTTSAIQAFKLYFQTGNIWGTFKLYGIT